MLSCWSDRLTVTANSLVSLAGVRQLTSLEHLLVQQNAITSVADLALEELAELPKLQSLYLVRPSSDFSVYAPCDRDLSEVA